MAGNRRERRALAWAWVGAHGAAALIFLVGLGMVVAAIAANVSAAVGTTLVVMGTCLVVLGAFAHHFEGLVELGPQGFKATLVDRVKRSARDLGLPPAEAEQAVERIEETVEALEPRRGLVEVLRERTRQSEATDLATEAASRELLAAFVSDPEWRESAQRSAEAIREQLHKTGMMEAAAKAQAGIKVPKLTPEQAEALKRVGASARTKRTADDEPDD
jgi:hypothetical protein